MSEKFAFLLSTRFWAIVITSASAVLIDPNFGIQPWYISLGKFLGLIGAAFTVVRTIDRNTGDAAVPTTTVSMPSSVKEVTATTKTK